MKNRCQKKHMVFNTIFSRFFMVLGSEIEPKIDDFSILFRKRGFCENRGPLIGKLLFWRSRASKKRPKIGAETHSKKASKENAPKIQKSTQHRKKSKKAFEQKAQKKEPWALGPPTGTQAFWDPAGPSNRHSND